MELTILTERRNSPFNGRSSTCSAMRSERSPFATAPITRAISLVGRAISSISKLVESTSRSHDPEAAGTDARCIIFPSLPTTRLTRSTSFVVLSLSSMMSLSVSAILPASPVHSPGRRAEKSPFLNATNVFSNSFALSESVVRVWVLMVFSFRRFQNREERADDQHATRVSHVMRPQSGITAPAARGNKLFLGDRETPSWGTRSKDSYTLRRSIL